MELQHFLSYYWFDWGFFFIFHHTPGEINELIFGTKISGERRAIFKSIFFNLDWQCSAPAFPAKKDQITFVQKLKWKTHNWRREAQWKKMIVLNKIWNFNLDNQLPSLISLCICLVDIRSKSKAIAEANPKNNWMRGEQACFL